MNVPDDPKYTVTITRLNRKRHHGLRYEVKVLWNAEYHYGDISWTYTRWGARREARRLIAKHQLPPEQTEQVEAYTVDPDDAR